MAGAEALADAFAFLQLRFQGVFFGFYKGNTTAAKKLLPPMVFEVVQEVLVELPRAQLFLAVLTSVQIYVIA